MWPGYDAHMGWMVIWWIVGVAVLVLLIWGVAQAAGRSVSARGDESLETILKRRYAGGQLDREEYERRLNDLRKLRLTCRRAGLQILDLAMSTRHQSRDQP